MLKNDEIIKVTNKGRGIAGYTIPDLGNLHRDYMPGETKEITMDELRKLSYIPGGKAMLMNYLLIQNEEAVAELLNEVQPEYYYTEEDVKELLLNGSLDALKDCLDYAPEGTLDLVKKLAVDLELNDVAKRKAILDMLGFNVTKAIELRNASEEDEEPKGEFKPIRRVTPAATSTTTGRRTTPTVTKEYKVVK